MNPLSPTQYPILTKYAEDLTLQISEGQHIHSLSEADYFYLHRMLQVLCRRRKHQPILIGEDSDQKLAIIHEVARLVLKGELPDNRTITFQRVLTFRHDLFFADTQDFDMLKNRLSSIVEELKSTAGQTALFVDDLHLLVGALSERTRYIGYPFLIAHARGEIRWIGTTTLENYRRYIANEFFVLLERKSAAVFIE